MQKAEKRLLGILQKAKITDGLVQETIIAEVSHQRNLWRSEKKPYNLKVWLRFLVFFLTLLIIGNGFLKSTDGECLIEMPFDATKLFREPEDCSFCKAVNKVDRVMDIFPELFDEIYASTGRPVVVSDGTKGWPANELFSFDFFKELYIRSKGSKKECQFFPYKTEFGSLKEALNMSSERANLEPGTKHWYIGWSNCNDHAGKILRQHYQSPYFLPETSENMALSWIFMGGPGNGAHMHIDNVRYTSWQAQLKGRKKWYLSPPPECFYSCEEFQVIVETGEIIVVDTNRWYHQTQILPGDISITIGTEFD